MEGQMSFFNLELDMKDKISDTALTNERTNERTNEGLDW